MRNCAMNSWELLQNMKTGRPGGQIKVSASGVLIAVILLESKFFFVEMIIFWFKSVQLLEFVESVDV